MNANSKPRVSKIKIKIWLQNATLSMQQVGINSARLDAELILCDALNVSREWLIIHGDEHIAENTAQEALQRRLNREPLAYIRSFKEFYGREFLVNKDVLIPRPESEVMIEVLKEVVQDNQKIIDIGTGSGALAVTAALELPQASVTASDVSENALKIARKNTKKLGAKLTFKKSDLLTAITEEYDIILANLPYVDKSWQRSPETKFEPSLALFAEDNGLQLIRKLIIQGQEKLRAEGFLLLESDPRQHGEIEKFALEHCFSVHKVHGFVMTLQKATGSAYRA